MNRKFINWLNMKSKSGVSNAQELYNAFPEVKDLKKLREFGNKMYNLGVESVVAEDVGHYDI